MITCDSAADGEFRAPRQPTEECPTHVELAQFYQGEFAAWQQFGPFPTKRAAWDFIKSHGFTAADQGDKWTAY